MIVIPGRIPVVIHPFFWLVAALIGWINDQSLVGVMTWIGIVFFSVLFHEFGHALTAVAFRQKANIQLVALGGLTSYDGPKLKFWQQFLIVLNGPLFGFLLFLFATLARAYDTTGSVFLHFLLVRVQYANLIWSIANLFPVLPLDGGQLLRIVLEAGFGPRGYLASLIGGAVLAGLFGLGFCLLQAYLIAAFFFLFGFQSFELWRKSRSVTKQDRDDDLRHLFGDAEEAFQAGKKMEAEHLFVEIRKRTSTGLLYAAATQYLAFLHMQRGQKEEAYQMLLPLETQLADEARCLLHQLAADHSNWELVAKLSIDCYQLAPTQATALRNARAFAFLHQPKFAGGWLQTAWQAGGLDLKKVLNEESFQAIKLDPDFQHFIHAMR
ncbi:MAG: M50 family metallopeptidase [Verrucomicrobiota bacterium]|nr:M50 family metallopeptidase [Verrucomicrobiota bacterium]